MTVTKLNLDLAKLIFKVVVILLLLVYQISKKVCVC